MNNNVGDINSRIFEAYEYLIESNSIKNQKDFAEQLAVSNSVITDLKSNRAQPGLKLLRGFVISFPQINIKYIIAGIGNLTSENPSQKELSLEERVKRLELEFEKLLPHKE